MCIFVLKSLHIITNFHFPTRPEDPGYACTLYNYTMIAWRPNRSHNAKNAARKISLVYIYNTFGSQIEDDKNIQVGRLHMLRFTRYQR
jgi:hypothetical protein